VQLRLLRQRVVMAAQKAQADVLLAHRPPSLRTTGVGRRGGEARCARRAPQRSPGKGPRGWTATSMRTTALASTEWAARLIRAGRAAPAGCWRRRLVWRLMFFYLQIGRPDVVVLRPQFAPRSSFK
jgi:hypothetical protein